MCLPANIQFLVAGSVVDHWARNPAYLLIVLIAIVISCTGLVQCLKRSPKMNEAPWVGLPVGVVACLLALWELQNTSLFVLALAACGLCLTSIGIYAARGELRQRFRQWLDMRRAFGRTLTDESRADPELLPEDKFPVWCPKCGYELRGLAEPRCPECGAGFDRSRLLVDQYVWKRGLPQTSLLLWAGRFIWLGLGMWLAQAPVLLVSFWLARGYGDQLPSSWLRTVWFDRVLIAVLSAKALAFVLAMIGVALYCVAYRGTRKKGRAVVAAIPKAR